VYNSHKYLDIEFGVIWSQNAKFMAKKLAKKLISTQHVIENGTSVSCNHLEMNYSNSKK